VQLYSSYVSLEKERRNRQESLFTLKDVWQAQTEKQAELEALEEPNREAELLQMEIEDMRAHHIFAGLLL
jgi:hypothetical protein